jgi:hypothetical protein
MMARKQHLNVLISRVISLPSGGLSWLNSFWRWPRQSSPRWPGVAQSIRAPAPRSLVRILLIASADFVHVVLLSDESKKVLRIGLATDVIAKQAGGVDVEPGLSNFENRGASKATNNARDALKAN